MLKKTVLVGILFLTSCSMSSNTSRRSTADVGSQLAAQIGADFSKVASECSTYAEHARRYIGSLGLEYAGMQSFYSPLGAFETLEAINSKFPRATDFRLENRDAWRDVDEVAVVSRWYFEKTDRGYFNPLVYIVNLKNNRSSAVCIVHAFYNS